MGELAASSAGGPGAGVPRGALALMVGLAAISAGLTVAAQVRWDPRTTTAGTVALGIVLMVAVWLVESVRAPAGLDRAGRVALITAANTVLLPAAVLLPPSLFLFVALARGAGLVAARGWPRAVVNGCIATIVMSAAAVTFALLRPDAPGSGSASGQVILALVAAGVVLLVVESIVFSCYARRLSGLDSGDVPLLVPREVVRDLPDVLLGGLACLAVAEPAMLLLVLPLVGWRLEWIREQGVYLNAFRDSKTGLLTAAAFIDLAAAELSRARRSNARVSLLVLDMDGLGMVNKQYGLLAGDRCIAAMAGVLRQGCREEDLLGRFGGDEFLVLLPDTRQEEAVGVAERLRRAAGLTWVDDIQRCLAISVGVVEGTGDSDIIELFKSADRAMRRAKETGRDRVAFVAVGEAAAG